MNSKHEYDFAAQVRQYYVTGYDFKQAYFKALDEYDLRHSTALFNRTSNFANANTPGGKERRKAIDKYRNNPPIRYTGPAFPKK